MTAHLLLLAGTAEARVLAERLNELPDLKVTASLAGVTADPAPIAARTRRGGFGGAAGLAEYLASPGTQIGASRITNIIPMHPSFTSSSSAISQPLSLGLLSISEQTHRIILCTLVHQVKERIGLLALAPMMIVLFVCRVSLSIDEG